MTKKLKVNFLGTGAADFYLEHVKDCKSKVCINLKKEGGKNIRRASSILIDDKTVIDMCYDNYVISKNKTVDYLIITHCHLDHFYPKAILEYIKNSENIINIYGNFCVGASLNYAKKKIYDDYQISQINSKYNFTEIYQYKEYKVGELKIFPFLANHMIEADEYIVKHKAYNYLIKKNNKKLIYALDTAPLLDESVEFLTGIKADGIVIDSTFGILSDEKTLPGHHNFNMLNKTIEMMKSKEIIKQNAQIVSSHISSHNIKASHAEMQKILEKEGIILAYDGLEILI